MLKRIHSVIFHNDLVEEEAHTIDKPILYAYPGKDNCISFDFHSTLCYLFLKVSKVDFIAKKDVDGAKSFEGSLPFLLDKACNCQNVQDILKPLACDDLKITALKYFLDSKIVPFIVIISLFIRII